MDAGAFVQENKHWLIGCAIGGVVWMIGSSVISTLYPQAPRNPKLGLTEAYDRNALDQARDENEQLNEELIRLKSEMAFEVAPGYSEWSGPADQHLFVSGRNLKQAILDEAGDRDCLVEDTGLANPSLLCTPFEDISARNMVQAARNGSLRILCSSDSLLPILLRRRFFETETGASRCIDEDGFAISNVFIVILSIE